MTTVLVTGANGFVGSHTLDALTKHCVKIIAAVRDASRLPSAFKGQVRCGDLRDPAYREQILEGVDVLCMCAAWTSAWGHAAASQEYFLQPTVALLETAVKKGVAKVVFPSSTSASVLRALPPGSIRGDADAIWPHMANVLRIEDRMQTLASPQTAMVVLRLGLFAGRRYGLGLLPILLPRLRSHLVPWVGRGRTGLPLIADTDIGQAVALAAVREISRDYSAMDVVGTEIPTARQVFRFLHKAYGYPLPHFGVSFPMAYAFARAMENFARLTPWDPFITRSVVLLLQETAADNRQARTVLGYEPKVHWKNAIRAQMAEMQRDRVGGLRMAKALPSPIVKAAG